MICVMPMLARFWKWQRGYMKPTIDLLRQQGMIDYDDMILGALRVLAQESVQQYWQERVFAVFEDEAQDSSPLQTELLEQLAVVRFRK
jgi:superfamily I DNA/RNA helicase